MRTVLFFAGKRLVRMPGCLLIWVQGCIEKRLYFMRPDISDYITLDRLPETFLIGS